MSARAGHRFGKDTRDILGGRLTDHIEADIARSRARIYKEAILVQSACNVAGILNSLVGVRKAILEEIDRGEWLLGMADHPVLQLYLHQLCFLTSTGPGLSNDQWKKAYIYCQERA